MKWIIDNIEDAIQKYLINGQFYEKDELEIMRKYCKPGSVIVDVGANVGNHAVYFSKFFDAKTIYVIEPIPRAFRMLLANLCLNYCHNVNVDFVGVALGHIETVGYPFQIYGEDNLGSVTLYPYEVQSERKDLLYAPVKIVPGDKLFENIEIDFIKIDVEGMELEVLEGLKNTIAKCRPNMYIEVQTRNIDAFLEYLKTNDYEIAEQTDREIFTNYMVGPK
jgi:FkbM family methyltransferase